MIEIFCGRNNNVSHKKNVNLCSSCINKTGVAKHYKEKGVAYFCKTLSTLIPIGGVDECKYYSKFKTTVEPEQ